MRDLTLAAGVAVVAVSVAKAGMPDWGPQLPAAAVADAADGIGAWTASDVVGAGAFVVCLGCALGVGAILVGGFPALLMAIFAPGGVVAAAGCIVGCAAL